MARTAATPPSRERFGRRIERPDGRDFPFYGGLPTLIPGRRWAVVVAAVVVGFAALVLTGPLFPGPILIFVPAILFVAIPSGAYVWAAGGRWKAIFHRVTGRDVGVVFGFAALNVVVTFVVGGIVAIFSGVSANPLSNELEHASAFELAMFYPRSGIQLFGEELLTILPFLALLYLFVQRGGMSRRRAVLLSWVITAVFFGLLHLPTYDWNLAQSILVIGTARIILTLAYIRTKNIWVSTGAHVINDWFLFTLPLVLGAATS
ncbi:CPBP family intramembrane glutamic endopeptidase [Polymorphospora rubra]|uniref:CPBP family intramembrane glutamic endopeptidase n=1 Tax=Polymorphospora rubra TaxID=338584 RepID=UPI0033F1CFBE